MELKNLKILTDSNQITKVQRSIEEMWKTKAKNNIQKGITLGVKQSGKTYDVYCIEELNSWGTFLKAPRNNPTRYMNAFGFGNPNTSKSIICEINFNFEGKKVTGGLIVTSSDNDIYILHSGRLGGNYNSQDFWDNYDGEECVINGKKYAIVSKVEPSEIINNIISFVKKVKSIKRNKS